MGPFHSRNYTRTSHVDVPPLRYFSVFLEVKSCSGRNEKCGHLPEASQALKRDAGTAAGLQEHKGEAYTSLQSSQPLRATAERAVAGRQQ